MQREDVRDCEIESCEIECVVKLLMCRGPVQACTGSSHKPSEACNICMCLTEEYIQPRCIKHVHVLFLSGLRVIRVPH